jgi:hypothetical protein
MEPPRIQEELAKMTEWQYAVLFTQSAEVIAANFEVDPGELVPYLTAYDSRDATIGPGFILNREHFDVHRFHPPLIYGRRGGPDDGAGIAICRGVLENGNFLYALITYELPILSARAVPQLIEFVKSVGATVEIPPPET